MVVASAASPAVSAARAASAARLIVAASASVASVAFVAFAELAARVTAASSVALLAKGASERPLRLLTDAVELGALKRSVGLLLREEQLEVLRHTFNSLGGELFSALHILSTIRSDGTS